MKMQLANWLATAVKPFHSSTSKHLCITSFTPSWRSYKREFSPAVVEPEKWAKGEIKNTRIYGLECIISAQSKHTVQKCRKTSPGMQNVKYCTCKGRIMMLAIHLRYICYGGRVRDAGVPSEPDTLVQHVRIHTKCWTQKSIRLLNFIQHL